MSSRSISVIICVYTVDRWLQICAAVESIRAQSLACSELILVVDHNPRLYDRLTAEFPDLTVVKNQEESGLSGARNTGVGIAKGELIAFLDDDAIAHEDWLKFMANAYDEDGRVMGVGGLTLPNWQRECPAWLPREFYWVVGCNYLGMPDSGQPVRNLLGGNMSFRREVFEIVDGFRTGIGRTAEKRPLGCEETEFCIKLGQRSPNSMLLIEKRAMVKHYVPEERCRFRYFVSRCYAEGISKAQVTAAVGRGDGLAAERSYATRTLPRGVVTGLAGALRGDLAGVGRAGAIVAGLAVTAAGYAAGQRDSRPRPVRGAA